MKISKKLAIKKVTLRDLDDSQLDSVGGGCCPTVSQKTCVTCSTCAQKTCVICP